MRSLVIVFVLLTVIGNAQTVKTNTYDRFIRKHVIETNKLTLKQEKGILTQARLLAIGKDFSLFMEGYGEGALTIRANDELIFLLDNDSTVVAKSIEPQTFTFEDDRSVYEHEYSFTLEGLRTLSRADLVAIRKYGVNGYVDIEVPVSRKEELKKASLILLNEVAKVK